MSSPWKRIYNEGKHNFVSVAPSDLTVSCLSGKYISQEYDSKFDLLNVTSLVPSMVSFERPHSVLCKTQK